MCEYYGCYLWCLDLPLTPFPTFLYVWVKIYFDLKCIKRHSNPAIVEMFVWQCRSEPDELNLGCTVAKSVGWHHPTDLKIIMCSSLHILICLSCNVHCSHTVLLTECFQPRRWLCPPVFQDEKLDATSRSLKLAALSSSIKGPSTFLSSTLRSDTLCEYLYTEAAKPVLWQLISGRFDGRQVFFLHLCIAR